MFVGPCGHAYRRGICGDTTLFLDLHVHDQTFLALFTNIETKFVEKVRTTSDFPGPRGATVVVEGTSAMGATTAAVAEAAPYPNLARRPCPRAARSTSQTLRNAFIEDMGAEASRHQPWC